MGVFYDISNRGFGHIAMRGSLGLALLACVATSPCFAETPAAVESAESVTVLDRAVSTSPSAREALIAINRSQPFASMDAETAAPIRPLTRAATQARIDRMSPLRWLSRFGHVSVGDPQ
jgi:hypothetical protein